MTAKKPTEGDRWEAWAAFCDEAQVAPDTTLSPEELARRFNEETGRVMTPERIARLMPEGK